jgi:hypothetical protein
MNSHGLLYSVGCKHYARAGKAQIVVKSRSEWVGGSSAADGTMHILTLIRTI